MQILLANQRKVSEKAFLKDPSKKDLYWRFFTGEPRFTEESLLRLTKEALYRFHQRKSPTEKALQRRLKCIVKFSRNSMGTSQIESNGFR